MNVDHLRALNALFEHRHDALILLCLAHGVADAGGEPLHFRQLARTIIEQTGSYVPESNLSRSLPRLKEVNLVAVQGEGTRHPSYRPTALGERKAALLDLLLQALEGQDWDDPACDDRPPDA